MTKTWERGGARVGKQYLQYPIVCLGDSITANFTPTGDFPVFGLGRRLGAYGHIYNAGVAANLLSDMQARFTTDVASKRPYWVIILGGINDILNDFTAAAMETSLAGLYSSVRGIGARPMAIPITPFGGHAGWTAARETVRTDVNTWIKTVSSVPFADCENVLGDFTIPGQPKLKTQYDNGGGLHPNRPGEDVIAEQVFQQLFGGVPITR